MDETPDSPAERPSKFPYKLLFVVMLSPFVACGFLLGLCYLLLVKDIPPGYSDWLLPSEWDANSIGDFLEVRLPADATNLQIAGRKGSRGEYGVSPTLEFSFSSSPENALAFVNAICHVVYAGYNPFESMETWYPTRDSVLVRGGITIHYSHSPDVPETTLGNRCSHRGSLTEVVLDTSDLHVSSVSYRLQADRNHTEDYEMAGIVMPLENFQLYATGFSGQGMVLTYPTICLETGFLFRLVDYSGIPDDLIHAPEHSQIAIFLDQVPQANASIEQGALKLVRPHEQNDDETLERWDYCLTQAWTIGTHTVEMRITPPDGETESFEWSFEVPESLAY